MDQQKAKLKDMLSDVRQKCQEEGQMVRMYFSQSLSNCLKSNWGLLNHMLASGLSRTALARFSHSKFVLHPLVQGHGNSGSLYSWKMYLFLVMMNLGAR